MRSLGSDRQKGADETADMKGSVDHIICDPPFLSEDCQTKGEINSITLILLADLQ